jgi:hypothetical protein
MKKRIAWILTVLLFAAILSACGAKAPASEPTPEPVPEATEVPTDEPTPEPEPESKIDLPDGTYLAEFKTDSSMFHVNEANKGLGVMTVKDGKATIHVSLVSKTILNLYPGLAEDAQKDGAVLLEPTIDTVTYDDGMTEEVHGFDIPVPVIGEEFDLALIGKKGVWYDHKVSVQNPVPQN